MKEIKVLATCHANCWNQENYNNRNDNFHVRQNIPPKIAQTCLTTSWRFFGNPTNLTMTTQTQSSRWWLLAFKDYFLETQAGKQEKKLKMKCFFVISFTTWDNTVQTHYVIVRYTNQQSLNNNKEWSSPEHDFLSFKKRGEN